MGTKATGGIDEGERLITLALVVRRRQPVAFADIRRAMPGAYGPGTGDDAAVRRRFERDKVTLAERGLIIRTDADNNYSLDAQASYATPIQLDEEEKSLLRLLCTALLNDASYPFKTELRSVLAKLSDELEMPDMMPPQLTDDSTADGKIAGMAKLLKALQARKRLHFEYTDAADKVSTRCVEPFGCFFYDRNCYAVAYDPDADAERVFRLDRMKRMRVNANSPSTPDFEPRNFHADDWRRLPFQYGGGQLLAQVRFDASQAWRAQRLCGRHGSLQTDGNDGALIWEVQAADTGKLARWCVEHGPGITPFAPPDAAKAYTQGIRSACATLADEETADER